MKGYMVVQKCERDKWHLRSHICGLFKTMKEALGCAQDYRNSRRYAARRWPKMPKIQQVHIEEFEYDPNDNGIYFGSRLGDKFAKHMKAWIKEHCPTLYAETYK